MRPWLLIAALLACASIVGCSGQSSEPKADPSASAPAAQDAALNLAGLDQGPRAGESAVREDLVERGERLFKDKGCSACHTFGQRLTGPDLQGVTMRRTARWMENQILHPDKMVKEDPIARGLFAQFSLQMPNQGLTVDEAHAVIEYFKHKDHEAGEGREAGKEKH
jgi:mono/diheme cytochrome c family protein